MITITNEDNLILMKRYPDKYFELAIVDPPYGINAPNMTMGSNPNRKTETKNGITKAVSHGGISVAQKLKKGRLNSGGGHFAGKNLTTMNCDWDIEKPTKQYYDELFRVSKNQIIFGGNYFTDQLPVSRCWICWDKKQPWENFSQFELAWTSFDSPAQMFTQSNRGGANDENKIHPTQKPVKLYKWILDKYAKEGDKIIDTHLGSGSIAIACHEYDFDLTACELDKIYYDAAMKRLKEHQQQLTMF